MRAINEKRIHGQHAPLSQEERKRGSVTAFQERVSSSLECGPCEEWAFRRERRGHLVCFRRVALSRRSPSVPGLLPHPCPRLLRPSQPGREPGEPFSFLLMEEVIRF